jgi:transposase
MCDGGAMAQIVCLLVSAEDRARLEAIVGDRNRAQKHVARARIILGSAERLSVAEVARRAGPPAGGLALAATLCRSRRRRPLARGDPQARQGALERPDRPSGGGADLGRAARRGDPLDRPRHGQGGRDLPALGAADRQVHRLQPHRVRTFKRSNDPEFAAKLEDIVGLYVDPPKHAIVLSVDEKSQIQALDRTQPGLPIKPGKAGTMTHDYLRNGVTTLFAALNVLDGTVLGRCMQRHRHQEFLRFLNALERAVPAGKVIHVILDNYGSHKHPKVLKWLARHPRFVFHFTPTSGSWLNAVEASFSALTRRRLKRGSFHSIVDLQAAINRYIAEHNDDPKPFTWTKTPEQILAKLNPLNASVH